MDESVLERLKIVLRERDCPFFEDEELDFYYNENNGDFNDTVYQCLILKSQDTSLVLSGLESSDTSKYFRRIAQKYRRNNSGILKGD